VSVQRDWYGVGAVGGFHRDRKGYEPRRHIYNVKIDVNIWIFVNGALSVSEQLLVIIVWIVNGAPGTPGVCSVTQRQTTGAALIPAQGWD
jgi:hypothetical protein